MAVRKFVIVAGQSNALEVADAQGWEDLHPYVALRRAGNSAEQSLQYTGGPYSDSYTLPTTFFGGPQTDRFGAGNFGSWQTANVMGRAMQAVKFLTPYNPSPSYTNVGTGQATNYPGTCEIRQEVNDPVPNSVTFATNVRWQYDPGGIIMTRRSTGVEHTIAMWSPAAATEVVTVSPPLIPPPEVGEQFTYQIKGGAHSIADDELSFVNTFGGLQDAGSILDDPTLTGAVTTGNHPVMISRMRTSSPTTDTAMRVTMRTRPVSVGSTISFAESSAASGYTSLGGAAMTNGTTTITSVMALGDVPWVVGQPIQFFAGDGTLPGSIVEGTRYYVVIVSGRDIEVSATQGDTAITLGAGYAGGTVAGGPYATGASVPDSLTPGTNYYVTRKAVDSDDVLETIALTATSFSTAVGYVYHADHSMGVGEAVTFSGTVPDTITAGLTYYVSPGATTSELTSSQFKISTDPDDLLGTEVSLTATGAGSCTLTRADGYFSFYISDSRGGAELVAATDSGRWPPAGTSPTGKMTESWRGSLTGLQATCISGANVGISRALGDVKLVSNLSVVQCASVWPSTPQASDLYTIEVPPLGQSSVPFKKWALWLPWCPFEGRSSYRGPGLASVVSNDGSEVTITVTGVRAPSAGGEFRLYTSGALPSPMLPGRAYWGHTANNVSFFPKETYDSTTAIPGEAASGGSGNHVIATFDQNEKVNPFPPGFNYPNHHGIPLYYQSFEGPSLMNRNPSMSVAPGLGIKLHEYYGEEMNVAVCAFSGASIGHKEVYSAEEGVSSFGWLDLNQHVSWSPGEENGCFARFEDVLDSANLAFEAEGDTGECVGIVWLQGEEDASYLALANNYYRAAKRLKTAMRQAVKVKGLFSGEAETLPFVHPKIKAAWTYASTVNASIQILADEDAYARTCEVESLTLMDDGNHYDGVGMSNLSELAYQALIDMDRSGYTKVQICNMALASLGDTATVTSIDPLDGTAQAALCAQFYDLALNKALAHHNWDFSKRRTSPVAVTTDRTEWLYSYTLPVDLAGVISVLPFETTGDVELYGDDIRMDYSIENDANLVRRLYCNQEDVVLIYNAKVKDPTQWSDSFVVFLQWTLASMIAGPLFKGKAGIEAAQKALQMLSLFGQQAASYDSRKTRKKGIEDNDAPWDRASR